MQQIESAGGDVEALGKAAPDPDTGPSPIKEWLCKRIGRDYVDNVVDVTLVGEGMASQTFSALANLPRVTVLDVAIHRLPTRSSAIYRRCRPSPSFILGVRTSQTTGSPAWKRLERCKGFALGLVQ